jgi:cell division control protein 6
LLIELGYAAPRKGKPADELLLRFHEWLDKNRSVVVVLDEFDQLDDAEQIVYDLYQASEGASNELGLILISNEPRPDRELDLRSQSRLSCQVLEFTRYNADELVEILRQRAKEAFRPGVVTEHVLELIAEIVANESGDCRQAFSLLLRAGRRADDEKATIVEPRHVQQLAQFRPDDP